MELNRAERAWDRFWSSAERNARLRAVLTRHDDEGVVEAKPVHKETAPSGRPSRKS